MRIAVPLVLALSFLPACGSGPPADEPPPVVDAYELEAPWSIGSGGHFGGLGMDTDEPFGRGVPLPPAIRVLPAGTSVLVTPEHAGFHVGDLAAGRTRFTLRVLDAEIERPVNDAQVRLYRLREKNGDRVEPNWRRRVGPAFYPGSDGSVRIDVEGEGRVALVARAPGCVPVTAILDPLTGVGKRTGLLRGGVGVAPDGASATLWIGGGGRVSGRVHDETGEPLACAAVLVAPPDTVETSPDRLAYITNGDEARFLSAIFETGPYGRFDVRGLPTPGRYAVFAARATDATGRSEDVVFLPETRELAADVTLVPSSDLRVRVLDDRGRVIEEPWVTMDVSWGQKTATQTTESEPGLRWFVGVMPGPVRLRVNAEGLVGTVRDVEFDGVGEQEIVVTLRRGATLTGRLTSPDGAPLEGVEVRFAGGGTERRGETDADGRYELAGLPAAKGVVQIFQPGNFRSALRRGVSVADSPVDFTLQPLSAIRGRLDPRPECGEVTYIGPGGARSNWKRRTVDVAPDGTFVVEGIDGSRAFDLLIWPGAGACHVLRGTKLVPGETLDIGTLDGAPSARLVGRVVDAAGRPLPGATVYLEQFPVAQDVRVRTDARGEFTIPFAAGSSGVLVVEASDLPKTHYSLDRDPERTAVELCVHPGGTVAGTLPTTDAGARHAAYVEFRRKGGPGRWVATAEAGLGVYEIRLPAGTYTSRVRVKRRWIGGETVTVTDGAKIVLSIAK